MMWQNILPCYRIFCDVAKYSLTSDGIFAMSHPWFVLTSTNGLLILNMGLAKKVVETTNALGQ